MRRAHRISALLVAAVAAQASNARADDPVVNVVTPTAGRITLDAAPPASQYFRIQFKPGTVGGATIRVWPYATKKRCGPVPPETWASFLQSLQDTMQFHELGMTPSGTGNDTILSARVPPLQVGQRFCIQVDKFIPVTGPTLDGFAKTIANQVAADMAAGAASIVASLQVRMVNGFHALVGTNLVTNLWGRAATIADPDGSIVNTYVQAVHNYNAHLAAIAGGGGAVPPDASTILASDRDRREKAEAALESSIESALKSPDIAKDLVAEEAQVADQLAGEGTTPAAANYAAIDTGVAVAFPLAYAGGNGTPWLLPYVGLNLYATPVDRVIPLTDLVGQFWQRTSLTIGRVLVNPTLSNRTVTDFGFGYPVLAVGYRLSQFVRATVGSTFFRINASNPTSTATIFGMAPFLGLALDGDVIAIAQGQLVSPK
jgi:hypothetical protein